MRVRPGDDFARTAQGLSTARTSSIRPWVWVVVGLVVCFVWFAKTADTPLVHPDEGRYAEIAREMLASGDWTTPRLNGLKYFEKPPLQYWATAVAYQVFGISEWSARLWVALTGLACVLGTWFAASRLFGRQAGVYSALLLMASPVFVIASGVNSLDMGVTCFLHLALLAYLLSRQAASSTQVRGWMLACWAAMALAVLSKGLIGVVLPAAAIVCYLLVSRRLAAVRNMEWILGSALFLAITVPWFVQVARVNPEFLQFFFVHEHFDRFTTTSHHRTGPFWYFLPIVVFAVAPWIVACARGLISAVRTLRNRRGPDARGALLVWCVVVFTFFSVSKSKLPGYILPIIPALAMLAGDALVRGEWRRHAFWIAVCALAFGMAAFGANEFLEARTLERLQARYETFSYWAEAASVAFIVVAAIALYWIDRTAERRIVTGVLVSFYFIVCAAVFGYQELAPSRSGIGLAQAIGSSGVADAPVYSVRMYDQTLPFYLRRTVLLVDYVDEFALGLRAEPDRGIADLGDFMRRWREERAAFAVMPSALYADLAGQGLPMVPVETDRERVLVRRP